MQDVDYRELVEDSPLPTFVVRDGAVLWANRAARLLVGEEVDGPGPVGSPLAGLVHPDDHDALAAGLAAGERTVPAQPAPPAEWRFLCAGAAATTVEVRVAPVRFEGAPALALACWDVSQHVERQRDLAHRATHDRLTGLPNRSLFEDRWSQARSRTRRTGRAPVVAFCDVDELKRFNDRYGHLAGDAVLVAVARRLAAVAREEDTVARYGGDEFVVLVEGPVEVEPAALEERFRRAVTDVAVELPGGAGGVSLTCSVGLVVDDPAVPPAEVLARADARMYRDKRARRP
ncbi:diguanylate cyclase [Kineococcus sp. TRM81007]|uniref:sensor domain-containing diguanylate cyclase n=1 Tax=Kineococcus sp. TRM81007 TaxID=2925831 RepID=UPI001F561FF6|nr:diguanylate cyclase [Kineococcus sp. TRM81007]MCI2239791.1 diguanylate cyclase [Kineococcus sp. TRM81007]